MCTPADLMDSPPRLKRMMLTTFLLMSTNSIYLHGSSTETDVKDDLQCLTDYMFTINCTLSIMPPDKDPNISSYWLGFYLEEFEDPKETYVCMLSNMEDEHYFCSFNKLHQKSDRQEYHDMDMFDIVLHYNTTRGLKGYKWIERAFMPKFHIKPNPPCCLTVNQTSDEHQFTWEDGKQNSFLDELTYQLQFYQRAHKENNKTLNSEKKILTLDSEKFAADTEYAARVRSTAESELVYDGCWSDWSPAVHWTTNKNGLENEVSEEFAEFPPETFFYHMDKKLFISLCVVLPLVFLLSCVTFKKWRQSAFIPTPEPYFQSLYSECKGDFKSWVVTPNTADMLKAEETLQIDTMTKCEDPPEEDRPSLPQHQPIEESVSSSLSEPASDASLLGIPYAVSPGPPLSASGSPLKSPSIVSGPGSAVRDSGCWLCSDTSLDRDTPWYSNEYCTLSAFQKSGSVLAERHSAGGTFCKATCIGDYQNGCHQGYFGTPDIQK